MLIFWDQICISNCFLQIPSSEENVFLELPFSCESLVCVDTYAEEEAQIEYGNGPENQCQKPAEVKIGKISVRNPRK